MITPEERALFIDAAKQHPDLIKCMQMIAEGEGVKPEPHRQKQRLGHAISPNDPWGRR